MSSTASAPVSSRRRQTPASLAVAAAQARKDQRPPRARAGRLPRPTVPTKEAQAEVSAGQLAYRLRHSGMRPRLVAMALEILGNCDWRARIWRCPASTADNYDRGLSMRKLAGVLGVAEGTARSYRRDLERLGVLSTLDRRPRVNAYWLLPDGINRLFEAQKAHLKGLNEARKARWREEEEDELARVEAGPPDGGSKGPAELTNESAPVDTIRRSSEPPLMDPVEQLARRVVGIVHGESSSATRPGDATLGRVRSLFAALRHVGSGWDEGRFLDAVTGLVEAIDVGCRAPGLTGARRTLTSLLHIPRFLGRVQAAEAHCRGECAHCPRPDEAAVNVQPVWDRAEAAVAQARAAAATATEVAKPPPTSPAEERAQARWRAAREVLEPQLGPSWSLWWSKLRVVGEDAAGRLILGGPNAALLIAAELKRADVEARVGPLVLVISQV